MYMCTHMPWHVYRGQRTTFKSWLSPLMMVVPGIEFRLPGLVASTFIDWTIFPAQFFSYAPDKHPQKLLFTIPLIREKKVEPPPPKKNDLRKSNSETWIEGKESIWANSFLSREWEPVELRGIMSRWLWDTLLSSWGEEEVHLSFNRWF